MLGRYALWCMDTTDNANTNTATETTADSNGTAAAPAEKFLTADEFNRALSARLKRETDKLQRTFDTKLAEMTAALTAPAGDKSAAAGEDPLRKQHDAALAKLKQLEDERERERVEAAKAEEKMTLQGALVSLGIVNVKGAMAVLREDGRVVRNAEGQIVIRGQLADMPLDDGLKEWLATDEGKHYLPARGAAGSGATDVRTDGKPRPKSEAEKRKEAEAILSSWRG